eukprot:CAMPEP_0168353064 /NCGR_PEP_ID=MMETSP0213-20121227/23003_1 /TAXON_ID=151035 /ORGANISM="Euplotes harpa, Strain FSP1.4" /LENGTH=66 /DNA_ID=CAMNT_0008364553 /DNA_START=107 /DNA_END=304 /DNA_ORIENTATION=-
MKVDYMKLQRKYETEIVNIRALKKLVEDKDYEIKRLRPKEVSEDIASSSTNKNKEGPITESSSKSK